MPELRQGSLRLEDVSETEWSKVLAANLTTAFLVCREFAPRMKARKFGRIVNFASIAARRGSDRVGVHYAAAKGGIIGLTKTLALELGAAQHHRERDRAGLHQDAAHRRGGLGRCRARLSSSPCP